MSRIRRIYGLLVLALTLAVALGCGSTTKEPQTPVEVVPVPPPPKDAAQIARAVVQAKIGAMLRVDRLRGHPAGERLVRLAKFGEVFEGTGVDLLRDATLAFIASSGITRDDTAVIVVQHALEEEKLRAAIEVVMDRSEPKGAWLTGTKVPAARVKVRGHERLLLLADDQFLVVLPMALEDQVDAFAGPLKLTTWDGPEAVVAVVDDPSTSLRAKHAPQVPPTISSAQVTMILRPDGGVDLHSDGKSATSEQAKADAETLTREVGKATSVKIAFVRVRMFKKVPFRAEEDHVKADVKMSAKEVAKLLSMAEAFSP